MVVGGGFDSRRGIGVMLFNLFHWWKTMSDRDLQFNVYDDPDSHASEIVIEAMDKAFRMEPPPAGADKVFFIQSGFYSKADFLQFGISRAQHSTFWAFAAGGMPWGQAVDVLVWMLQNKCFIATPNIAALVSAAREESSSHFQC